jgi:hypothetical protein
MRAATATADGQRGLSATVPTAAAQLPLAEELERLRDEIEQAHGQAARRGARADVAWAQVDQARELAADPHARATAAALAAAGDPDAEAALARAERVGPPAPRSSWWEDPTPLVPPVRLDCLVAALARLRRERAPFDEAWPAALETCDLRAGDVGRALEWSRPAWEAAYERRPPPPGYMLGSWPEPEPRAPSAVALPRARCTARIGR